uniref:Major sperm protein n=1 Tax=Panagrolaimus sp. JU765 TaxID=591449 RepID=A0AC34QSN0_9BILA
MDRSFQLATDPANKVTFTGTDFISHDCTTVIKITNKSDSRQAFKVKCTRNDLFRIRPPSGILDFNAVAEVTISFKANGMEPESDKHHIGIYHIPAPEGATCVAAWAEHYGPPQGEKRLKVDFR